MYKINGVVEKDSRHRMALEAYSSWHNLQIPLELQLKHPGKTIYRCHITQGGGNSLGLRRKILVEPVA